MEKPQGEGFHKGLGCDRNVLQGNGSKQTSGNVHYYGSYLKWCKKKEMSRCTNIIDKRGMLKLRNCGFCMSRIMSGENKRTHGFM